MKFYFSTRHIPSIRDLPLSRRMEAIEKASKQLSVPEKTLLNILKLCVIVPIFALLMQSVNNWLSLLWALLVFLLYPLILKPIQYSLSAKYLPQPHEKETS